MAQCARIGCARAHLLHCLCFIAAQAGRLTGAPLSAYYSTWHQGTSQPFPRPCAVISHRLFLYFFGVYAVKERGHGCNKRLGGGGGRRSFDSLAQNPRCVVTTTVLTARGNTIQRNKSRNG